MLKTIVTVLRVTNWLNWSAAALLTLFFAVLLFGPADFRTTVLAAFPEGSGARRAVIVFLYGMLSLVPLVAVAVHASLTRLAALVRDADEGFAFSQRNAERLRVIAWAMLAINLADLLFGWLAIRASEETGEYFGWSFSLVAWIAVPLLFVLARVFQEGAIMREDLEGTI